jgi:hypothetical protein
MILLESNQYPVRIVCQGHQRTVLEEIVDEAHCPKRTFNFKANAAAIKQAQIRFDPGTIERWNHLQTNNSANSTRLLTMECRKWRIVSGFHQMIRTSTELLLTRSMQFPQYLLPDCGRLQVLHYKKCIPVWFLRIQTIKQVE